MANALAQTSLQMTRIGVPIIIVTSVFGNTLNIAILSRSKLRSNACSLYFLALSATNILYSSSILVVSLLGDGFQIRISARSTVACKLITYFGTILSAWSPSFMVLASIDRWCASSASVTRRNFSNVRTAKWSIPGVIVTFSSLFIISLVTSNISSSDTLGCRVRGDPMFVQVYGTFQSILFSLVAPVLMFVFGCLTIYNVQGHRITAGQSSSQRRTETQLIRMLLVQVGVQLVLTSPLSVAGLILSFPSIYQPTANFYSLFFIFRVLFHISYATPFFLYVLSARIYRIELYQLISKIIPFYRPTAVHPLTQTAAPTSMTAKPKN